MTWLLDLDGVVWLADTPIPGSAQAVARARAAGVRVAVATNNSSMTVEAYLAKLERMGVPTDPADLITSAQAAATLLHPGDRVLVCAGPGVAQAVESVGAIVVNAEGEPGDAAAHDAAHDAGSDADVVIVGWTKTFDYAVLTRAMHAVRAGARLIGTNDDATYPTPEGPLPGGGSLVAAVAYASGVQAEIAGKPYPAMVAAVQQRIGPVELMIGDRPDTDGRLAQGLGARFGLVLTGVTR